MSQIDLDDLPPKVAGTLCSLAAGEELVLVKGGLVVCRLQVADAVAPTTDPIVDALPPEEHVAEVMSQFNAMIHDEF